MAESLKWNGEQLKQLLSQAQSEAINEIMSRSVVHAKNNHAWQNRTGILEGSIGFIDYAVSSAKRIVGRWGSKDVVYAAIHEFGGYAGRGVFIPARPYLRPAADIHYPQLASVIKKRYRKKTGG